MITRNINGVFVKLVAAGIATFSVGDRNLRATRRGVSKKGGWSLYDVKSGLKLADIESLEQGVNLVKKMEGVDV